MRLKEDSSSWNASNVERKVKEVPDEPRPARAKKNTKRWCKGKVGVEHNYVLIEKHKDKWFGWNKSQCVNCGKKHYK